MSALGLPEVVRRFAEERKGLVLVAGSSGSGKTTTLASMVNHFNETVAGHILTIENPIEFVHEPKRCLINQREIGHQARSWIGALQSALREDPDVIMVGELNDFETIALAIEAAETGHLVLGAFRTAGAPKTLERILDICPTAQQRQFRTMIADSLLGVVSQMLVKKRDGDRIATHEVLVATPAVRNLIREGKMQQIPSSMQVGKSGMQTMEAALVALVTRGLVDIAEARANLPGSEMLSMLQRTSTGGSGA
jgi:twitching motility protein PilT